ncbi:MAG: amidohydrolase family protein [Cyclobacteriaceae bacterium]
MNKLRVSILTGLFSSLLLVTNCSKQSTAESDNPDVSFYSVDDFQRTEKFDSHIHLNTGDTSFIKQAQRDHFRFLVIVDDRPFGITMADQEEIVRKQLKAFPETIAYATTFSVNNFNTPGWQDETLDYLKNSFAHGAIAVKVWKNIGMDLKDENGKFVMIDNPKFDPVLDYLEENNIPLVGHLGEPRDCWLPLEEMTFHRGYYESHPEYHMYLHPEYPSYDDQINARDHMLEKHPKLKFIGGHLGSLEWSLEELAKRLDKYPNMSVDLARMSNLNFHAKSHWQETHDFFVMYQDRLLYATDVQIRDPEDAAEMNQRAHDSRIFHWKFFATDEMLSIPGIDGEFRGLKLPRAVVDKIYQENAERILGNTGIRE